MPSKKDIGKDMIYMILACSVCMLVAYGFMHKDNALLYNYFTDLRITPRMIKHFAYLEEERYEESAAVLREVIQITRLTMEDSMYRGYLSSYALSSARAGHMSEYERYLAILEDYYAENPEVYDYPFVINKMNLLREFENE